MFAVQLLELVKESANKKLLNLPIMCVGHNRGWQEAASSFTGTQLELGTSNAALMQIEAQTWEEALSEDSIWELVGVLTPHEGLQGFDEVSAGVEP